MFGLGFWAASAANGGGGAAAYELISTTVLGSAAATVTFSGLGTSAANYKHLQLRYTVRAADAGGSGVIGMYVRPNNDTTTANYTFHQLYGNGSTVGSTGSSGNTGLQITNYPGDGFTANAFNAGVMDLLDFASTTKYKTSRNLGGHLGSSNALALYSGVWMSTAAITSLVILNGSGQFAIGSRFSLYGLRA